MEGELAVIAEEAEITAEQLKETGDQLDVAHVTVRARV